MTPRLYIAGRLAVLGTLFLSGCVVSSYCFSDNDCTGGATCSAEGRCEAPARRDLMVTPDSNTPLHCPLPGMVLVGGHYCVDTYEASRPDATPEEEGFSSAYAVNKAGVIPWQRVDQRLQTQ